MKTEPVVIAKSPFCPDNLTCKYCKYHIHYHHPSHVDICVWGSPVCTLAGGWWLVWVQGWRGVSSVLCSAAAHSGDCQTCASQLLHSSSTTSHLSDNFICFEVQVPYLVRYKHNIRYDDKSMSKMVEWFLQRQSSTYLEVDITCLNGLNANLPACITDDLWTI